MINDNKIYTFTGTQDNLDKLQKHLKFLSEELDLKCYVVFSENSIREVSPQKRKKILENRDYYKGSQRFNFSKDAIECSMDFLLTIEELNKSK